MFIMNISFLAFIVMLSCLSFSDSYKISNVEIEEKLNELERLLKQRKLEDAASSRTGQENNNYKKLEESTRKKLENERTLEKIGEGEKEQKEEEELDIDHPEDIDPNDPIAILLEGEIVEENGQGHKVIGLHPQDNAKTYGDSHDHHPLTDEQQESVAEGHNSKRGFMTKARLWQKGVIPYKIVNMTDKAHKVIKSAIQQFDDYTCIRWVPEADKDKYKLNHRKSVNFVSERGCWSFVGSVKTGQKISLGKGCVYRSIAVHEMLHAMGAHHEQSRTDRDNYVSIVWENLRKGTNNGNMRKVSTHNYNPFDGQSALMYALYSFSKNGQRTIKFHDQRLEFLADSAKGLEYYDIKDVNAAYKCADHCTNPPSCENGGFVYFRCECICPDGLTGPTCAETVSNNACGGVINIGPGENKYIESPNFPFYPTGLECTWLIKGQPGSLVRATVEYMDLAAGAACYHWLEYRYNLLGQTGPKRCGTNFNAGEEYWDSTMDEIGNAMMIKFNSNMNSNKASTKGFKLTLHNIGTGCASNPCMYGTCTSPEGSSSFTCTCSPGVSGTVCDILDTSSTIGCTFEYGEKCFLENQFDDKYSWDFSSEGTPSPYTGPSKAHGGYQYIYAEASSPRRKGDTAVMANKNTKLIRGDRCLSFYYNMYGFAMGTLNVYTEGADVNKSIVFTESGQHWNKWLKGEVDIPAMDDLTIYVEAVRGNGYASDIALDDVLLTPGSCTVPDSCESGWIPHEGRCYFVEQTSKKTWQSAQNDCKDMNANLITVEDLDKDAWVKDLMKLLSLDRIWIGASDTVSEGQFRWIADGNDVTFTDFYDGEPNNYRNEDCLEMRAEQRKERAYKWNDVWCSYSNKYVCQKDLNI